MAEHIEILPLVIVTQVFPARPSSLPDVRDFVRRQLTSAPLSDDDVRTLCDRVAQVLLDAASASGTIQVSLRIFSTLAEVDVLFAQDGSAAGDAHPQSQTIRPADGGAPVDGERPAAPIAPAGSVSFADWLAGCLRREGMTMEAAARRLKVSAKTISRWVAGTTEPRLRDLYRIRDVFGEPPFPSGSS